MSSPTQHGLPQIRLRHELNMSSEKEMSLIKKTARVVRFPPIPARLREVGGEAWLLNGCVTQVVGDKTVEAPKKK